MEHLSKTIFRYEVDQCDLEYCFESFHGRVEFMISEDKLDDFTMEVKNLFNDVWQEIIDANRVVDRLSEFLEELEDI